MEPTMRSFFTRAVFLAASFAVTAGKSTGGSGTRGGSASNRNQAGTTDGGGGGIAFFSSTALLFFLVAVASLVCLGIAGALFCYCKHGRKDKEHSAGGASYRAQLERAAQYVQGKSSGHCASSPTTRPPLNTSYEMIFDLQGTRITARLDLIFQEPSSASGGTLVISGHGSHEHHGAFCVSEGKVSLSGHAYWVQQPQQARKRELLVRGVFDHDAGTFRGEWVSKDGSKGECMAFQESFESLFLEDDAEQSSNTPNTEEPWRVWDCKGR